MRVIIILLLASYHLWANEMERSYAEGGNFAKDLPSDLVKNIANCNLAEIPAFQVNPPETNLDQQHAADGNLYAKAMAAQAVDEVGQDILHSANGRKKFRIDPQTDPLFKAGTQQPIDPLNIRHGEEVVVADEGYITKTCEEGGEDITYTCLDNRIVTPQVPVKTTTLTVDHLTFRPKYIQEMYVVKAGNFWRHTKYATRNQLSGYEVSLPKEINAFKAQFCQGFSGKDGATGQQLHIDCQAIKGFNVNSGTINDNGLELIVLTSTPTLNITLEHQTYAGEATEKWSGCEHLEKLVDEGLCQYGARRLTQAAATRHIGGYAITKDAWQYQQSYRCKMLKNECEQLRAQGCYQVKSNCKDWKQNKCWIYLQEYHCPSGTRTIRHTPIPLASTFCLTGNCHDTSYTANGEMLNTLAQLSVLKAAQQELTTNRDFAVFKGDSYQCSRNCLSFKDCCGGMQGWGIALQLTTCKPEEQQLAKMRAQQLCHQVGNTYCAKRDPVLNQCLQKKTSFCCFGSKLARMLQEQGRSQLGISWGQAKCPNCRALTIAELANLNLIKINFSELFNEVRQKYQAPNTLAAQNHVQQSINQHITQRTKELTTNAQTSEHGVVSKEQDGL